MAIIKKKRNSSTNECGDCVHFRRTRKYEETCNKLGVLEKAKAPSCFSPDITTLRKIKDLDNVEQLGELTKDFTKRQRRILSYLMLRQNKITELGFYFGQPVFVCLGSDYLSHYYKGYVVDVDLKTEYVYVVARLKESKYSTSMYFPSDSILDYGGFKEKAVELVRKDKLVYKKSELTHFRNLPLSEQIDDSGKVDVSVLLREDLTLDVPTIDNAPKGNDKKKRKKSVKDLSEIYTESSRGIIRKLKT